MINMISPAQFAIAPVASRTLTFLFVVLVMALSVCLISTRSAIRTQTLFPAMHVEVFRRCGELFAAFRTTFLRYTEGSHGRTPVAHASGCYKQRGGFWFPSIIPYLRPELKGGRVAS